MWFALSGCSTRAVPSNLAAPRIGSAVRTLVVVLVLAGAVAVGGGQLLEARATEQVSALLAASTARSEDVDVELEGFPVAFRAAAGRIPRALIEVERLTTREPEVTFAPVVLELRDVRFDPFDVALGEPGSVTVGDGSASATLPAGELSRLVAQQGSVWELQIGGGQLVATGTVQDTTVRVVAGAAVVDGALRLTAREVAVDGQIPAAAVARAFERTVPLPDLPGRVRLTDVEVGPGGLVLHAAIRGVLDLGT